MNIVIKTGSIKYFTEVENEEKAGAIICEGFIKHISTGFDIFLKKYHFEGLSGELENTIYTFDTDKCSVIHDDGTDIPAGDFVYVHTQKYGVKPANPDISMYSE